MSATTLSNGLFGNFKRVLRNPTYAFLGLLIYITVTIVVLSLLDRRSVIFPLLSTLAFPPLVLAPFVTLALPIDNRLKGLIILVLLFIVLPVIGMFDGSYLELAIQICIFSGLALGLNIVVGFAGLLDLGYIAFFAVGAYLWAMFTSPVETYFKTSGALVGTNLTIHIGSSALVITLPAFYTFMIVGVVVAGIGGILLGLPVLRLRGDYLAIVTLGFGEMIRILAQNSDSVGSPPINFTNGSQGLNGVGKPPIPQFLRDFVATVERLLHLDVANVQPLTQQLLFYFIAIVVIVIIVLVARRLENSPIGRAWTAIREDEVAAIAMGVPLVRMKLTAFAMGASFAGAIGVLYAAKQTFVSPESFSLIQSISILAMVIVGGIGSIQGVLLGAAVVTLLNLQVLQNLSLQINNWRNNKVVVPQVLIIIAGVIIALILLRFAWKNLKPWIKSRNVSSVKPLNILIGTLLVILAAAVVFISLASGDFPIANWPNQLELAKYQRFIFGILLIVMMIFRPAGLLPAARRRLELQTPKVEKQAEEV